MAKDYDHKLADEVDRCLKKTSLHYSFDGERGRFTLAFNISCELKKIDIKLNIYKTDLDICCVLPVCPDPDDSEQMACLSENICRHNSNGNMLGGRIEMDFRDGEIGYYKYIDCSGGVPMPEVLEQHIRMSVDDINTWASGYFKRR